MYPWWTSGWTTEIEMMQVTVFRAPSKKRTLCEIRGDETALRLRLEMSMRLPVGARRALRPSQMKEERHERDARLWP